jgi:hypothetical protein
MIDEKVPKGILGLSQLARGPHPALRATLSRKRERALKRSPSDCYGVGAEFKT